MMGRLNHDQQQLFYSFRLDEAVPDDHPVRNIAAVLDLSWVHSELAQFYPKMGRPSIDPELMIRMLIIGYVFAIRSERAICRDLQVNLAYRWFCRLSTEDKIPDHSVFSRARHERFRQSNAFRRVFERVVEACIAADLVGGEGFAVDASLIAADANKQRSIPGSEWNKTRDSQRGSRAMKEYLATLDDNGSHLVFLRVEPHQDLEHLLQSCFGENLIPGGVDDAPLGNEVDPLGRTVADDEGCRGPADREQS